MSLMQLRCFLCKWKNKHMDLTDFILPEIQIKGSIKEPF